MVTLAAPATSPGTRVGHNSAQSCPSRHAERERTSTIVLSPPVFARGVVPPATPPPPGNQNKPCKVTGSLGTDGHRGGVGDLRCGVLPTPCGCALRLGWVGLPLLATRTSGDAGTNMNIAPQTEPSVRLAELLAAALLSDPLDAEDARDNGHRAKRSG